MGRFLKNPGKTGNEVIGGYDETYVTIRSETGDLADKIALLGRDHLISASLETLHQSPLHRGALGSERRVMEDRIFSEECLHYEIYGSEGRITLTIGQLFLPVDLTDP